MALRAARAFRGDKLLRTAAPHPILDPAAGPLIAVRLSVLTRKTLGGLQTDLSAVGCCARMAHRCRACMPRVRLPGSAAEGCTAIGPWRAPSSAAVCSPAESPGAPLPV
jgi:hypothetical protein